MMEEDDYMYIAETDSEASTVEVENSDDDEDYLTADDPADPPIDVDIGAREINNLDETVADEDEVIDIGARELNDLDVTVGDGNEVINIDERDVAQVIDIDDQVNQDEVIRIDDQIHGVNRGRRNHNNEVITLDAHVRVDGLRVDLTATDIQNQVINIADQLIRTPIRPSTSAGPAIQLNDTIDIEDSVIEVDSSTAGNDSTPHIQPGASQPRIVTPEKENAKPDVKSPGSASDDESECCPICFERWENSGSHRLAALKCGHLFGQSCIQRWLSNPGCHKCPQCNAKAYKKDIRPIYAAKSLKMVDTTERDKALGDLEKERKLRHEAEMESAQLRLNVQMAQDELRRLREEVQRQQSLLHVMRHSASSTSAATSLTSSQSLRGGSQGAASAGNNVHKFVIERAPVKMGETAKCRVMAYFQNKSTLCVSQQTTNPLFPGYGVKKLNGALDFKVTEYIPIHSNQIRDFAFKPNEREPLILSASIDKSLKLTSMDSKTTVLSYALPTPVWSCAFNLEDTNYMYAGLTNGTVSVFDIRNTAQHVHSLEVTGPRSPVPTLFYVPAHTPMGEDRMSGLLLGQLNGVIFFEKKISTYKPHVLNNNRSICSLAMDRHSLITLLSFRPTPQDPHVRHQLTRVVMQPAHVPSSCSLETVHVFQGGSTQKVLPRNKLLPHPEQDGNLLVCASDEASSSVLVWEATTGSVFQKLPVQGEPVVDMCHIHEQDSYRFCALTEKQVLFYQWR